MISETRTIPEIGILFSKYLNKLRDLIPTDHSNNLMIQTILSKIIEISKSLTSIVYKTALKEYEPILLALESSNRLKTSKIIELEYQQEALDTKIKWLNTKEQKFEQWKIVTNANFINGEWNFNDQKEREILILRSENSNLKTLLNDNEEIIRNMRIKEEDTRVEYDNRINAMKTQIIHLNQKIDNYKKKWNSKRKNKSFIHRHIISASNININVNEASHPKWIDWEANSSNNIFKAKTIKKNKSNGNSLVSQSSSHRKSGSIAFNMTSIIKSIKNEPHCWDSYMHSNQNKMINSITNETKTSNTLTGKPSINIWLSSSTAVSPTKWKEKTSTKRQTWNKNQKPFGTSKKPQWKNLLNSGKFAINNFLIYNNTVDNNNKVTNQTNESNRKEESNRVELGRKMEL